MAVLETRCETIVLFGCTRRKLATDMEDCTNKLSVWQEIICTLKPKGKRPPVRPRRSWEDNNKMYLQEIGLGGGLDRCGSGKAQVVRGT